MANPNTPPLRDAKETMMEGELKPCPFEREERYIVFKKSHLTGEQLEKLERLTCEGPRGPAANWHDAPLPTVECVVVESDWPEYETVWRMIEDRVTGRATPEQPARDGLVGAARNLALRACELNIALDGQETLRPQRQALLDALAAIERALSPAPDARPDVEAVADTPTVKQSLTVADLDEPVALTAVNWQGRLHCAYLNEFRIAGGKPWGGGSTGKEWKTSLREVIRAFPALQEALGFNYLGQAITAAHPPAPDARLNEAREALEAALRCTPNLLASPTGYKIVYDCGDPFDLIRTALRNLGGSDHG